MQKEPEKLKTDAQERIERVVYYQSWTRQKMLKMVPEDLLEYLSQLWAMLIWGNKQYVVDPQHNMLWNRRAYVGLEYLGVQGLPRYNYQLNGKKYKELSAIAREIAGEMKVMGAEDTSLLAVDYFIWEELQVEENLSRIHKKQRK